jgi:hypothetical protein
LQTRPESIYSTQQLWLGYWSPEIWDAVVESKT